MVNGKTLSVRFKGKHIGEVLAMNIDQAAFFESITKLQPRPVFTTLECLSRRRLSLTLAVYVMDVLD